MGVVFYKRNTYWSIIDLEPLPKAQRATLTRQLRPRPTYYLRKTSVKKLRLKDLDRKTWLKVNRTLVEGKKWLCCPDQLDYLDSLPLRRKK